MRQPFQQLCLWLAPEDTAEDPVLPLTLLVRPLPLLALIVLGLNDHWWKGSGIVPGVLTGKISDVAGLLYFPLLLVTLFNGLGWVSARLLKRPLRWASPSVRQVTVACLATGVFFAGVQTVPGVKEFYSRTTAWLTFWSDAPFAKVTMDPTDLVALPVLLLAWWVGARAVGKLPPGRIVLMRAAQLKGEPADVAASAGVGDLYARFEEASQGLLLRAIEAAAKGDDKALDETLAALRTR